MYMYVTEQTDEQCLGGWLSMSKGKGGSGMESFAHDGVCLQCGQDSPVVVQRAGSMLSRAFCGTRLQPDHKGAARRAPVWVKDKRL